MTPPRTGPCSAWITDADVRSRPDCRDLPEAMVAEAADVASDLLYVLSGRQFTGSGCGPVLVRPVSRPIDSDLTSFGTAIAPFGYFSSWGTCSFSGYANPGVVSHYGCSRPSEIDLGAYPVTEIVEVKIDGTVIPSDEYELQSYKTLVRMLPTPDATPTEMYGWPTCQQLELPDTQPGTFSVTYTYGADPPTPGILAAKVLAGELALAMAQLDNALPQRVTSVNRQGVTVAVVDAMDFLKTGNTGLYEVDLFIKAYNPHGARRYPRVWSPDRGRARRSLS